MIAFYNNDINERAKLDNAPHYGFCCPECIFRECWSPGVRTTESVGTTGVVLYGQRLRTDIHEVYICTWMFDHGCPDKPKENTELGLKRTKTGWRSSAI